MLRAADGEPLGCAPETDAASRRGRVARSTGSLSLTRRAVGGSALLAVLVAGSFGVTLIAMSDLRGSTDLQAQSRNVTSATLGLEQVVNELEGSLRAFIVSGNARLLVSWQQSQENLPRTIAHLRSLLTSQPSERRQAVGLSMLIDDYVSEYGRPLIRIFRLSPAAARAPVATSEGLLRIDTIRVGLERLLVDETALASAAAANAEDDATTAERLGVGALSAAAGLLVLYAIFLVRGIARPVRTVARGASRVAAGDLSTRLPEGGAAEIDALTRAFNEMASSLERGNRQLEAQNDDLRESERLQSQLVSIVSHELRTPLASILGYTSLLRTRHFERAESQHYLDIIHLQGRRLASLVDHFLDGERVGAGRIELDDEPLDLRAIVGEEARLLSQELDKHRIELAIGGEPLPVRGDRDRLAQVVVNLLTNAIKYSPDGGLVAVEAELGREVVSVRVRDEGIGIPEEHQSRIFTKFFRANARESGIAGTGLGLAVAREIVEAHGGRIGFSSAPGAGSTFWFELPRAREPQPPSAASPEVTVGGEALPVGSPRARLGDAPLTGAARFPT